MYIRHEVEVLGLGPRGSHEGDFHRYGFAITTLHEDGPQTMPVRLEKSTPSTEPGSPGRRRPWSMAHLRAWRWTASGVARLNDGCAERNSMCDELRLPVG